MGQDEIRGKITALAQQIIQQGGFQERDVVYFLVEIYKIVERESGSGRSIIIKKFPHLTFYRDWETDRKSTRLNSSHSRASRMPSSA